MSCIDQGYTGPTLRVEHFRDPEKLFTFQSCLAAYGAQVRSSAGIAMLAQGAACVRGMLPAAGGYECGGRRVTRGEGGEHSALVKVFLDLFGFLQQQGHMLLGKIIESLQHLHRRLKLLNELGVLLIAP